MSLQLQVGPAGWLGPLMIEELVCSMAAALSSLIECAVLHQLMTIRD